MAKDAFGEKQRKLSLLELSACGAFSGGCVAFVLTPIELVKCRLVEHSRIIDISDIHRLHDIGILEILKFFYSDISFRMQVQQSLSTSHVAFKSPIDVVVRTFREEGIRGMYRGHSSTLMRDIPGGFIWFGAYEAACMGMTPHGGSREDLTPVSHMIAGATAGVTAWTAVFPADVVKSRIQTDPQFSRMGILNVRIPHHGDESQ